MDKQFIPVLAATVAVFLILLTRPSILIHSDKSSCPYCLNAWLVSLIVVCVGGATYAFVNQDVTAPTLSIYN